MNSLLVDLETRRKILFSSNGIIIRMIGSDSIVLCMGAEQVSHEEMTNAKEFLMKYSTVESVNSLIIDISQSQSFLIEEALAFGKLPGAERTHFAIFTRKFIATFFLRLRMLLTMTPRNLKIFSDFNRAVAWSKSFR